MGEDDGRVYVHEEYPFPEDEPVFENPLEDEIYMLRRDLENWKGMYRQVFKTLHIREGEIERLKRELAGLRDEAIKPLKSDLTWVLRNIEEARALVQDMVGDE